MERFRLMFYQLKYDMDLVDKVIEKKKCYIYGDGNNINDIEYENYPKGRFHTIIHSEKKVESWPNVEFYYNSLEMTEESDYLGNIDSWPIFRKNVVKILKKEYPNLEFYPVKLIDVATGSINTNYFVLHVLCVIDAFDMKNSKYRYNEKYDVYFFEPKGERIDSLKCQGVDVFRASKNFTVIYVSDKFSQMVMKHKWTGFAFYRVAEDNEEQEYIEKQGI